MLNGSQNHNYKSQALRDLQPNNSQYRRLQFNINNNSTFTHNGLQMDEEQCRRLCFGAKPVCTKPTQRI